MCSNQKDVVAFATETGHGSAALALNTPLYFVANVKAPIAGAGMFSRALGRVIFGIDDVLRARHHVFEFSQESRTIFRMQVRACEHDVTMSDATRAFVGDRMIDLHLWNEHLPLLKDGSLRFARRMNECLHVSLGELATYVAASSELDDIEVIRANMGFGTLAQTRQLLRISSRYGFEPIGDPRRPTRLQLFHRFGENVLISLMVLARNDIALRRDSLARSRVQVFLSRRALLDRYLGGQSRIRDLQAPS